MSGDNKECQDKQRCSVENYIREDAGFNDSICREERQYAVFLYNILRKYHNPESRKNGKIKKIITKVCNIPENADIKHVFYEATFMRDFFERNRQIYGEGSKKELEKEKSFNYKLLEYVCATERVTFPESIWTQPEKEINPGRGKSEGSDDEKQGHVIRENNLGRNKIKVPDDMKRIQSIVREMMNATPDLAIIYHMKGNDKNGRHELDKDYLLFLECKFESRESRYESGYRQCEIQGKIADFLCKKILKDNRLEGNEGNIEVSPLMRNSKKGNSEYAAPIIQFIRKRPGKPKKSPEPKEILISDLICLNNQIFL